MNQNNQKISYYQVITIMITMIGITNHVMIIPMLLTIAHRDAWLSVLFSYIPYFLWFSLFYLIIRKTKQKHIIHWLDDNFGKWVTWPLLFMFSLYLLAIAFFSLFQTIVFIKTTFLPNTPNFILSLIFVITCIFAAYKGIRTIAITTGTLLPFVIILGFFVATTNIPQKNYSYLMPFFENGVAPSMHGIIYSLAGLSELFVLLFIQHNVVGKISFKPLFFTTLILIGLTLGPLTGAIAAFGPFEASKMRFPAFEQWRLVHIGQYIEHLDFLSIYQWLVGAFVATSTALFMLIEILGIPKGKKRAVFLSLIGFGMIFTLQFPFGDLWFYPFLLKIFTPLALYFIVGLTLLLSILVLFAKKGRKVNHAKNR